MTNIVIKISGTTAHKVSQEGKLTTGMVGATVTFEFGPEWAGLSKTAVFRAGGVTRDVVDIGDTVPIPVEVLQAEGYLAVGVEGYDAEHTLVIPTTWEHSAANIHAGANASGDPAADPTLPIWAQLQAMIGDLSALDTDAKNNLVAAINEQAAKSGGTVDGDDIAELVEQYLADNPITAADVGAIPAPAVAEVGQTIRVKAVDEDGKPVEWECVDAESGLPPWRKLRTFAVPADPSTDTSGITWITNTDGGVIGFEFDADYNGEHFECTELSIKTSGSCLGDSAITFLLNGKAAAYRGGYQNTSHRYGWGEIQKRNGFWRWIGAWVTAMRPLHDNLPINATMGEATDFDTIAKFGVKGAYAFNAGYSFNIWGR